MKVADCYQSATFIPLVRQLTVLAQIAVRTGKHQIGRVITTSTTQRNNVVNMIVPAHFNMTVVALTLLIGILFLNILCSIGTLCSLSTNFAVSIQQQDFLDMGTVVIPSMLVYLLYMSFSIFLIVFRMLFIVFLGLLFAAFLAMMTQAILATFVSIEVDDRTRIPIQTGGALLITSIVTCFAHVVQTICISSVYPEISSSCGKFLETYRARFRWYTIHGKGPSLSSWRMYQHHSSTTIFMGLL